MMDHIDMMDELRNYIGMRGYAQHDPIQEYKKEGMEMFELMTQEIQKTAVMIGTRSHLATGRWKRKRKPREHHYVEKKEMPKCIW